MYKNAHSAFCKIPCTNIILNFSHHVHTYLDQDGAEPSPNSYSALNLLRLSAYLPGKVAEPAPIDIIKTFGEMLSQHPIALPEMLSAFIFHSQTPKQVRKSFIDMMSF